MQNDWDRDEDKIDDYRAKTINKDFSTKEIYYTCYIYSKADVILNDHQFFPELSVTFAIQSGIFNNAIHHKLAK